MGRTAPLMTSQKAMPKGMAETIPNIATISHINLGNSKPGCVDEKSIQTLNATQLVIAPDMMPSRAIRKRNMNASERHLSYRSTHENLPFLHSCRKQRA